MDRYLFRGFHKEENGKETIYIDGQPIKGKWVEGYYHKEVSTSITLQEYGIDEIENHYIHTVIDHLPYKLKVIPETIGQWSGLENPWEQKIFEHDILRDYGNEIEDWKVSYEYGKFVGSYDNVCEDLWEIHDMEVIGNIFDEGVRNE